MITSFKIFEGKISGIPLRKMSKETFEWWVGSENVINGKIKVFRGTDVKNAGLRTGDFVTMNKEYAGKYGTHIQEFDIPIKYLNYFSGVKGGDPEQLHSWNLGKKAQPTELIYSGEFINRVFEGSVKSSDRIDIFRDEKYVVVAPLTEEASMKYGADSHWCTSVCGSGAWCEESRPNNENSRVGLIILIRRNYKMTPRNEKNSELYYYLNRQSECSEITKREMKKMELLREDDDYLNMSKLTIVFSINKNDNEVWAANNIQLDWIYSLYDLVGYGIDDYVIDEVSNYISQVRKYKKFKVSNYDKVV